MFGLGVGIGIVPEVLEGSRCLIGGFESLVRIKVINKIKGYVGSKRLKILAGVNKSVERVGSVRDW